MEVMTVLLSSLATLTRISNRLRALLLSRPDVGSCMGKQGCLHNTRIALCINTFFPSSAKSPNNLHPVAVGVGQ